MRLFYLVCMILRTKPWAFQMLCKYSTDDRFTFNCLFMTAMILHSDQQVLFILKTSRNISSMNEYSLLFLYFQNYHQS